MFDFSHVTRVLDAWRKRGFHVIVGTPDLCHSGMDGEGLSGGDGDGQKRQGPYGARQIMDITHRPTVFLRSASSES